MSNSTDSIGKSEQLRHVAVVGCGYWGKNLVRNFAQLGVLRTICDANPATLDHLTGLYPGVTPTTTFKDVLADPDIRGVVIATPAATHFAIAYEALEAGKDVFVEKPLALKVEDGERLVEKANRTGQVLMVGHLLEYHPAIIKLKELVASGKLGKIKYIYSNRLNLGKVRTEEDILLSFAPHDISVILSLLGESPREVSAHGGEYLNQGIADVTVTTMTFAAGTKAHIFVSWLHPFKEQKLIVIGGKMMAVFDDVAPENKLVLYDHRIEWRSQIPFMQRNDAIPVELTGEEPLNLECRHFLDCMESRQRPRTDGASALKILKVLQAAEKSLKSTGMTVTLDEMPYFVHPSSIVEKPSSVGAGTKIWHYSHLMPDVVLGDNCTVGQNVFVGRGVHIGNNVKLENNVSVFEGVTLEDDVFCGPSCTFTNVRSPRSHISQKGHFSPTIVKKGASIGANATVICGNTIGRYSFIGAGAVVTTDVPDYALVFGSPARIHGWVCECGTRLPDVNNGDFWCPSCQALYTLTPSERGDYLEKNVHTNTIR